MEDPEFAYITRKAMRAHKRRQAAEKKRTRAWGAGGQEWLKLHREDSIVKRKDNLKQERR